MKLTIDRRSVLIFALLLALASFSHSQVSPFMALGNAQFFDNNGKILAAGVLYSFQAGTSTQQATFTDSTGSVMNPNPIPFGSGARVSIWLTSSAFYKFVLCAQNDGAACAPADVLFSVDQVPGCPSCSSGGSTFTGTFISGTANPATTGILRLASADAICWRNAAGTANLCITKDSSDILDWTGGAIKLPELNCSITFAGLDYLCPNSSMHRLSISNNGAPYGGVPTLAAMGISGHLTSLAANGFDLLDSGGTAPVSTPVTFSSTPTFTATSQDQLFTMTLTGNVTSSTLSMSGLPVPSLVSFELTQDGTGGRTFVQPTNVIGTIALAPAPNAVTLAQFLWDGTNARSFIPPCILQTKTANYTLTAGDCLIQALASGGSFTVTIPRLITGVVWEITRTDSSTNVLTIAGDAGQVNGAASIKLPPNATTVCHADGVNSWCTTPGGQFTQATTLTGCPASSTCTFTYPVLYTSITSCVCSGEGGSCNIASKSATSCVVNTSGGGSYDVIAVGIP